MAMRAIEVLPDDSATLKALIEHERATHVMALEEIERLRAQMRLLLAQRFGAKSERVAEDSGQFGLFNEAETDVETTAAEHPAIRRGRPYPCSRSPAAVARAPPARRDGA